jgi:hypothetical protein
MSPVYIFLIGLIIGAWLGGITVAVIVLFRRA